MTNYVLVRIADLFRFRLDPAVLAVLAERPNRYRALHTGLQSHIGEHVDDNALTRSLQRLTKAGLVRIDTKRLGSRVIKTYALSDKGRELQMMYAAFVKVYTHLHQHPCDCDGSCGIDLLHQTDCPA